MTDNYNPSQSKVWSSALNVSKKIYNLTSYYIEEDLQPLAEILKNKVQTLQDQLQDEIREEEYRTTFSGYQKSLVLIRSMEEDLISAFDQGCITERELKTTLEAISIYVHEIQSHQNKIKGNHQLLQHLQPIPQANVE